MAVVTNTVTTHLPMVGMREELADMIYRLSPEETPLMTMIGRSSVKTTHPEWMIDELAVPGANAQPEGNEWTFQAQEQPTRVGNYTQISDKRIIVSRTADKTDKAARSSELARLLKKRGIELKQDMEFTLLSNQASVAGALNTARQSAGLPAWITTNTPRGAGGADGGFNATTGIVDAATVGTLRAFTKALLDEALSLAYSAGGDVKFAMMSPYNKGIFSAFAGIATLRSEVKGENQATIYAGADTYVGDFGTLTVVPNRVMAGSAALARRVILVDPDHASVGIFDDIKQYEAAKTGDAEKRALVVEYTLRVDNEAAFASVEDVFGLTAST
ncbi:MAG: DUF5309 domain-containing protein [Acidobacteria bacterium]|nr:DUF5309 domain-containing protein [Acidobacteriota bacterium]